MNKAICTAKKPLIHGDGTESFTPGKFYYFRHEYQERITPETMMTNNQGEPHKLSIWAKHFSIAT